VNTPETSPFFDTHGRFLPAGLKAPAHPVSRHWFLFQQPEIDYAAIHARTLQHLGQDPALAISASAFETRAQAIQARLLSDPACASLAQGVGVPFLLPADRIDDYGQALEEKYIPAVNAAFKATLPAYDFVTHHPQPLNGKLRIAPESRHTRLMAAASENDVVGWFYPCLREYSVPAMREAVATLPDSLLLAGGLDACAALVGNPSLFLRLNGYPPLLWLAALDGEKEGIGYHFEAYGYNLTFNRRAHLGQAAEYWAGAVVAIG
jgi:hypothetical protein